MFFFSPFNLLLVLPIILFCSFLIGAFPTDALLTQFPSVLHIVGFFSPFYKEKLKNVKAVRDNRSKGTSYQINIRAFAARLSSFLKQSFRVFILDLIDEDMQKVVTSSIKFSEEARQKALTTAATAAFQDNIASIDSTIERLEAAHAADTAFTKKLGFDMAELALELSNVNKRITSLFDSQVRLTKGVNGGYCETEKVKKAVKVVEEVLSMVVDTMDWKNKGAGLKARAGVRSLSRHLEDEGEANSERHNEFRYDKASLDAQGW